MEAAKRRQEILALLLRQGSPITGGELAQRFGVTRQVIVQDIALLRAAGNEILATPQGYRVMGRAGPRFTRQVVSCHSNRPEEIERELNAMVDAGATVLDVIVEHPLYGELRGWLMISTRQDVRDFLRRLEESRCEPLLVLTGGIHLHTVEAADPAALARVEERLRELGMSPRG